jgi:hypothetical protein
MISDEKIKEAVELARRVREEALHVAPFPPTDAIITGLLIAAALDDLGINIECGGDW